MGLEEFSSLAAPFSSIKFCNEGSHEDQRVLPRGEAAAERTAARSRWVHWGLLAQGPKPPPPCSAACAPSPGAPPHRRRSVPWQQNPPNTHPSVCHVPSSPFTVYNPGHPHTPPGNKRPWGRNGGVELFRLVLPTLFKNTALIDVQFTYLKCAVQSFSVYSVLYSQNQNHFRTFHHPAKKPQTH